MLPDCFSVSFCFSIKLLLQIFVYVSWQNPTELGKMLLRLEDSQFTKPTKITLYAYPLVCFNMPKPTVSVFYLISWLHTSRLAPTDLQIIYFSWNTYSKVYPTIFCFFILSWFLFKTGFQLFTLFTIFVGYYKKVRANQTRI